LQAIKIKNTINCKGRLINLAQPVVMGIINTNSDSFYSGSRAIQTDKILQKAEQMLVQGATFLDFGAQSTRPGAELIGAENELKLVIPAIEAVIKTFPDALISIDTFNASVAKAAINAGACMVNDVSAGDDDPNMIETIAELNIPYIIMHKKGLPKTMQQNPTYNDVFLDISTYFANKVQTLKQLGLNDIIIDPGFGFGKTINHNFTLLNRLADFSIFELPVLVGISRKSMIQKTINCNADNALNGTIAANTIALINGANILRVHDVKEAVETIKIYLACKNN
jgi:dihydropteroate synthase